MRASTPARVLLLTLTACRFVVQLGSDAPSTPDTSVAPSDGRQRTASAGSGETPAAAAMVTMVSPNGVASYLPSESIRFLAALTDGAGRPESAEVQAWSSDKNAAFGGADNPLLSTLSPIGLHRITYSASVHGLSLAAAVSVRVADPSAELAVRFLAPADGAVIALDDPASPGRVPYSLEIAALPALDASALLYTFTTSGGAPLVSLAQTSPTQTTLEGGLAQGTAQQASPPPLGAYALRVSVCAPRDPAAGKSGGCTRSGEASVQVMVLPENHAPVVHIDTPASDGQMLERGAALTLLATVSDPDMARTPLPDDDLEPVWSDSLVGALGVGTGVAWPAQASALLGKHTLSVCVTDHAGKQSCDERSVYVASDRPLLSAVTLPDMVDGPIVRLFADSGDTVYAAAAPGFFAVVGGKVSLVAMPDLGDEGKLEHVRDFLRAGNTLIVASDEGLWRCAAAPFDAKSCAPLPAAATAPNALPMKAPFLALTQTAGGVLAAGPAGVLWLTGGDADVPAAFFARGAGLALSAKVLSLADVAGAVWLVVDDPSVGVDGVCVTSGNPFATAEGSVACGAPPAALASLAFGRAASVTGGDAGAVAYIGSDHGLLRYDTSTSGGVRYDQAGGLSSDQVTSIAVTRAGIAWVGTPEGLSRVDTRTGLITRFTRDDFPGATSSEVFALAVDAGSTLWVSMGQGTTSLFNYRGP